ncbi:MAG: UDP-N-acetylmuramoyl-L-alanine--D-glutamate ligase [Fusobacteriaceae bacterium]
MKKAMIFGAGISGKSAEKLLIEEGYKTYLVDDKIGIKSEIALSLLGEIDLFIKSPGVPYTELVKKAFSMGIEVIDEVELAYRNLKRKNKKTKIIAITGTNGKTTTTTKIAELITYTGKKAIACGNIGKPFSEVVIENQDLDFIVIELSSFQLENLKEFKADISMIINLAPDHLERYSSVENYYEAKFNICKNNKIEEKFILNTEDFNIISRKNKIFGKISEISKKNNKNSDIYIENNRIMYDNKSSVEISELSLKGQHNLENILFILATAKILKLNFEKTKQFLYTTKSIEHRLEEVLIKENTVFINDSKGTNIDSTRYALEAFPKSILICGGKDKKLDLNPLAELIILNAKEVYLIGENRKDIKELLLVKGYSENKIFDLENLENCIKNLKEKIKLKENNTILFSPATSSFDQFKNYEERGNYFKKLVLENFGG